MNSLKGLPLRLEHITLSRAIVKAVAVANWLTAVLLKNALNRFCGGRSLFFLRVLYIGGLSIHLIKFALKKHQCQVRKVFCVVRCLF